MKRNLHTAQAVLYGLFVCGVLALLFYFLAVQPRRAQPNETTIWISICFITGGMFMMAIYNIALWLFRRSEKSALWFSLFCIGQAVRFFFMDGSIGHQWFPGLSSDSLVFLRYFSFCVGLIGLICFVYDVFGAKRSKKLKYTLLFLAVFVNTVTPIFGFDRTAGRTVLGLIAGVPYIAGCAYMIIRSGEIRKNPLHLLYLFGFIIYSFSLFSTATSLDAAPYMAAVFTYVFVIAHAVLLSDRYARAIAAVEKSNDELEVKVAERTSELMASERHIRELIGNISHDLKTPMTVMGANLEMMQNDEPDSDAFKRHLSIAAGQGKELARLTGELLEVARADSSDKQSDMEWVSLSSLLEETYGQYADTAEEAGLDLLVDYGPDCEVWIDRDKIRSVFRNIMGNALKFTDAGAIRVAAGAREDDFISVAFTDTGCGIPPEHLPHIFELRYMADPSRVDGSGMGLYLVRTNMERMGGSVSARSEPGSGTEITIRLKTRG